MTLKSKTIVLSCLASMVLITSVIIFQGYRSTNIRLFHALILLDQIRHAAHKTALEIQQVAPDVASMRDRLNSIPGITGQLHEIFSSGDKSAQLIEMEMSFVRVGRIVDRFSAQKVIERPVLEQINNETTRIEKAIDGLSHTFSLEMKGMQTRAEITIAAFFLLLVAYIAGVLFFMFRMVIQPVLLLSNQLEAMRDGRLEDVTSLTRDDEIGKLAASFNRMISKRRQAEEKLQLEITQHKRTVDDLRYSQTTLESVFRNSIPMCITNREYEIIHANDAYHAVFSDQEDGKIKCYESRPGPSCHTENCPMRRILRGEKIVTFDSMKPDRAGRERNYIITARPFLDANGEIDGIVESFQDITERRMAEQENEAIKNQLVRSQKMEAIGTMAGGIAHDFNNILAIIVSGAQLIKDEIQPGSPADDYADYVIQATRRGANLIKQILTFSRKSAREYIPVEPHVIIKEYLKMLRSATPTSVTIKHYIDECGVIDADPTQLQQVVMNLCVNAVQAMDEEGILEIRLQQVSLNKDDLHPRPGLNPGPFVKLSVRDDGVGIGQDAMACIFDPFFTTKAVGKGTGLGLSVVHGIVESHGGIITVDSEPGNGATFNVFFPVSSSGEAPAEEEKDANLLTGNESILLVDDEETIVKLVTLQLEKLGYRVSSFASSVEAFEIFKSAPDSFDLVITDQSMPVMSGVKLSENILAIRPDIPIILCTGYSQKISKENIGNLGIKGYVNKPIVIKKYAETIRMALGDGKSGQPH